jgi:hypothetical protein
MLPFTIQEMTIIMERFEFNGDAPRAAVVHQSEKPATSNGTILPSNQIFIIAIKRSYTKTYTMEFDTVARES